MAAPKKEDVKYDIPAALTDPVTKEQLNTLCGSICPWYLFVVGIARRFQSGTTRLTPSEFSKNQGVAHWRDVRSPSFGTSTFKMCFQQLAKFALFPSPSFTPHISAVRRTCPPYMSAGCPPVRQMSARTCPPDVRADMSAGCPHPFFHTFSNFSPFLNSFHSIGVLSAVVEGKETIYMKGTKFDEVATLACAELDLHEKDHTVPVCF